VPELSSDAQSPGSSQSARRRVARRYLTGLSAAGLTAALALTMAVGDASASPSAKSPARVVTLISSSSAPTGHLTVQVKYQPEKRGRNKVVSVTFSGASRVSLRHPALVISLRPVLAPPLRRGSGAGVQKPAPKGGPVGVQVHAFTLILRIRDAHKFTGALSARVVATINKVLAGPIHRVPLVGRVLSVAVASIIRHKRQVSISTPVGLQTGVLLGPVAP
jgi:hypothetical protein